MNEAKDPLERPDENPENLDQHTGLLTKDAWKAYVAEQIEANNAAEQNDIEIKNCGVIFMDLGNFKAINDRYGHEYGDEIIEKTQDVLMDAVRQANKSRAVDYLAHEKYTDNDAMNASRVGGDEFAVFCDLSPRDGDEDKDEVEEPLTAQERIALVESRLRSAFDDMIAEDSERLEDIQFSVSIGSAVYEPGMNSSELLSRADEAMMQDKREKQRERWEKLSPEEKSALLNPFVRAGLQKLGIRPPELPDSEFDL